MSLSIIRVYWDDTLLFHSTGKGHLSEKSLSSIRIEEHNFNLDRYPFSKQKINKIPRKEHVPNSETSLLVAIIRVSLLND